MNYRDLSIEIRYRSDIHNFPRDFLVPVLSRTVMYKRGTGYFSTSALIDLSKGLFDMTQNGGKIEVICSPNLAAEDIEAINQGYKNRDEVIKTSIINSMREPNNYYEEERLNLVATLVARGMMDIKVAFLDGAEGIRLYHEKIAVFTDKDGNKISYAGSANESENGLEGNFESLYTFCSWKDQSQQDAVIIAENDFDNMWEDKTEKLHVIPFPQIAIKKLMQYKKADVDWDIDEKEIGYRAFLKQNMIFHMPSNVVLHDYQEEAVSNWFKNDNKGIFDMCTGSGKTYTALACMVRLADACDEQLAVFIVCPYIHLVSQWEEDVVQWTNAPVIIAHSKSKDSNWKQNLLSAYKRFKFGHSSFVCITTNDTFSGNELQQYITRFSSEQNVLIIADEAHNFGSAQMIKVMSKNISNRIALSATIKRYMDKSGTEAITEYFGKKCIEYGLERAIREGTLSHYTYYPIPVYLTDDELDMYSQLTQSLRQYIIIKNGKVKISEAGKIIIFKRMRLLGGAANKIPLIMELMDKYKDDNNILIYCGAASVKDEDTGLEERQIDIITRKLQQVYDMSVKRFTAEETLVERENIKEYFSQGMYQVVTAIKCLDEGVNIPGIKTAFIMSSSRNPKEFVQRRGRLLRKSANKDQACIYDFITLPRDLDDVRSSDLDDDKSILFGEISRMTEFGALADNSEQADLLINRIMTAYDYYFDVREEEEKMEDYYAE
jgi:superfamily II DNA or RNA helicase